MNKIVEYLMVPNHGGYYGLHTSFLGKEQLFTYDGQLIVSREGPVMNVDKLISETFNGSKIRVRVITEFNKRLIIEAVD